MAHETWVNDPPKPQNALALIPVRGRSTGLANKNMRLIDGIPLLGYTIAAAKKAKLVSEVVVSTDDESVALYARGENVEGVVHPRYLSDDDAETIGVVLWNFQRIAAGSRPLDMIVVLRATSPLRTAADIDEAVCLLSCRPEADSLVSVVTVPGIHPIRMKRILQDGTVVDAFESEGHSPRRRQTLEQLYVRNGAIYIARPKVLKQGALWGDRCLGYIMPQERSININTQFDFTVAELLIRHSHEIS